MHIEPQVFDLLCFLLENRGRAVTKADIYSYIWGDRAISDAVLTTRMRSLRRAIDDVGGRSHIRTLHKIGYEFLAPVTLDDEPERIEQKAYAHTPAAALHPEETELRQAVAVALQPRLALDKPFDPERLDRLSETVRRELAARIVSDADAIVESVEGTIYALVGAQMSRDGDIERAAQLALDFADTAFSGDAGLALAIGKGKLVRSADGFRGTAMLRAAQAVGQARAGEVVVSPELVGLLPEQAEVVTSRNGPVHLVDLDDDPGLAEPGSPFVGRVVEAGLIESAVDAMVERQSGGCITLEGVAGVGKSRMAQRAIEMVEDAGGRGALVFVRELSADGVLHRNVLRGLVDLIGDTDTALAGVPPDLRSHIRSLMDGSVGRSSVRHSESLGMAIIGLLRLASEKAPLLIALEDAHWIDSESHAFALQLAGHCSEIRVIFLITARPQSGAFLNEISERAQGDIVALTLSPLSDRQSRTLAIALAPQLDTETLDNLVQRAGGNPLFLSRLIEAFQAKGPASLAYVPGTVQSVVQIQFDQLSDAKRALLRRLSVLGERFEKTVAEIVYGRGTLREAPTAGFLRDHGDWFQFAHNLVRESVYATLPVSERSRLHTAAATLLVSHDPLLAAEHAMRGDLGEAPAICVKVARDTFHFRRHGRSVALISEATKLDCTPDQRAQLEVFLGSAAVDLGDEEAAMAHYRTAAESAESSVPAVFALVRIARLHVRHYRMAEAHEVLDRASQWITRDPGPGYLASEIAEARSILAWAERKPQKAIAEGETARDLADHPHPEGRALRTLGWAYFSAARFNDARACADMCLKLVEERALRLVEPDVLAPALRFRWYAEPHADRLREAHAFVSRADEIGIRLARMQTRVVRLEIAWELLDWETFDEDCRVVETEILKADRLSLSTLRFFQALNRPGKQHLSLHPDPGLFPEGSIGEAFLPLALVLNPTGATNDMPSSPTPLESLWIARLTGKLDDQEALGAAHSTLVQSEKWRRWCFSRGVRR
ncbi:MAG: winged helix-turn-helix domain-containing protein [Pseudomonadota bacterium]